MLSGIVDHAVIDLSAGGSTSEDKPNIETSNKKQKVDILGLPPSQYDRNIFVANNPFVRVVEVSPQDAFPISGDKIGDTKSMDPAALWAAMEEIIEPSLDASFSSEIGGRILHGAFALDLYKVTKPASTPVQVTPTVAYDMQAHNDVPTLAGGDDDQVADVLVVAESSNEDIAIRHEGDDPDDTQGEDTTKYHFKVLVHDRRVQRFDNLVTVLVVECTWDTATKKKIYQAAAYVSRKDGIANMSKGRFAPIFLQSWGKNNWMYGVYFLFGIIEVKNNQVVKVRSHTKGDEYFNKMLNDGTRSLRMHSKDSSATYPDGDYIHGMLYLPRKEFLLPDVKVPSSSSNEQTKLFFQSLIRIVAGDGALAWTEKDVRDIINIRNKAKADRKAAFFGKSSSSA